MDSRFSKEQIILKGATEYNGDALPTSATLSALTGYDTYDNFWLKEKPTPVVETEQLTYLNKSLSNNNTMYYEFLLESEPQDYTGTFTGDYSDSTSKSIEDILNMPYLWLIEASSTNEVKVVAGQDESLTTAQNLPVVVQSINRPRQQGYYTLEVTLKTRDAV